VGEITLVLGGARSGKSELAERLALALGTAITYVATGPDAEGDDEWAERVRRHRARRDPRWRTVETGPGGQLGETLRSIEGPALVDSLGTWVAGHLDSMVSEDEHRSLLDALLERRSNGATTIVVSEEVGLGVHPSTAAGRHFRDALGSLNCAVSEIADAAFLVVAGRVLALTQSDAP